MKITCPGCGLTAEVPDDKIPVEGTTGTCPKCKTRFLVSKPVTQQNIQVDTVHEAVNFADGFIIEPLVDDTLGFIIEPLSTSSQKGIRSKPENKTSPETKIADRKIAKQPLEKHSKNKVIIYAICSVLIICCIIYAASVYITSSKSKTDQNQRSNNNSSSVTGIYSSAQTDQQSVSKDSSDLKDSSINSSSNVSSSFDIFQQSITLFELKKAFPSLKINDSCYSEGQCEGRLNQPVKFIAGIDLVDTVYMSNNGAVMAIGGSIPADQFPVVKSALEKKLNTEFIKEINTYKLSASPYEITYQDQSQFIRIYIAYHSAQSTILEKPAKAYSLPPPQIRH
jgi:predicted Zn finger-like uncharacterized protein